MRGRCALVAALLLQGAFPARAAPPDQEEPPIAAPYLERAEVRFVTVDLIAERKIEGTWTEVGDLTEDRVTVFVGKRPVELDVFENWCRAPAPGAAAGGGAVPEPARPEEVDAGAAPAEEPNPGPDRYILYFDLQHLKMDGLHASFQAARAWAADAFRPDDEVMIITGSLGIRILREFRPASEGLAEDLDAAEEDYRRTGGWAEREDGRIREIRQMPTPAAQEDLATSYAALDRLYALQSLQNLHDLMAIFESIEGTKNLVLFQQDMRILPGIEYPAARINPRVDTVEPSVRRLASAANESNVRIYPVDAGGLEGEKDDSMFQLASETGGRFYRGSNDVTPTLGWIAADEDCFYRMGFRVEPRFSGSVDRIGIEIDSPRETRKYRLRYRRTLSDPTREEREVDRIRAALIDPSTAEDVPVLVQAAALLSGEERGRARLQIRVPFEMLLGIPAGEPGAGLRQVSVHLAGSVVRLLDEPSGTPRSGSVLAQADTRRPPWSFNREVLLQLPEGAAAGRELLLAREIDVPPGRYRIIAVVEDRLAGELGAAAADVVVPEPRDGLGEPVLLTTNPRFFALEPIPEEATADGDDPGAVGMAAEPSLPADWALDDGSGLVPSSVGRVVYEVCGEGGTPERALVCGGRRFPTPMPSQVLGTGGIAPGCELRSDLLPVERAGPGACTYEITAELPDGRREVRSLAVRLVR